MGYGHFHSMSPPLKAATPSSPKEMIFTSTLSGRLATSGPHGVPCTDRDDRYFTSLRSHQPKRECHVRRYRERWSLLHLSPGPWAQAPISRSLVRPSASGWGVASTAPRPRASPCRWAQTEALIVIALPPVRAFRVVAGPRLPPGRSTCCRSCQSPSPAISARASSLA